VLRRIDLEYLFPAGTYSKTVKELFTIAYKYIACQIYRLT